MHASKMWRFLLYLFFAVVIPAKTIAEEVKHNLPDNLEIIDPKSLGLSDADVEKFLGNVKLLPIGGDMGNNIKTQILTVGFEGDEKLDLADFDIPNTDGLPDKDKEVAQVAFQRFQDFFKNPGGGKDFDKVIEDSEQEATKSTTSSSTESSSSSSEADTTTPHSSESVTTAVQYSDVGDENNSATIETPLPRTTTEKPSGFQGPIEFGRPIYNMNAEEVIRLLKTSGTFENLPGLSKFGGFLTGPSNEAPGSNAISGESSSQFQTQPSVQKEQVLARKQNEISQEQQHQNFIQSLISSQSLPTGNPNSGIAAFQIPLMRTPQGFVQPHHQQVVTPFIIQQGLPPQPPPQQQAQSAFPAQQQPPQGAFTTIQAHSPQQPTQQAIVPAAQIARQPIFAPQQVIPYAPPPQVPVISYQQAAQVPQHSQVPAQATYQNAPQQHHQQQQQQQAQQQHHQSQQQQQQQQHVVSFPQPIPLSSQTFQAPNRFAQNFTPSRGPPQESAPVTPRPSFVVTPSIQMIPISTVENAIHHPPVVPQHLHQSSSNSNTNNNNNPYASSQEHLDIVAKIAREQHLRISQQPASLPSHPGHPQTSSHHEHQQSSQQQQHQQVPTSPAATVPSSVEVSGKHGAREISQVPLTVGQQQAPSPSPNTLRVSSPSPSVIQQQPQQQQQQQPQYYLQQNPIQSNGHNQLQRPQQPLYNSAPAPQQYYTIHPTESSQPLPRPSSLPPPPPSPSQRPYPQQQFLQYRQPRPTQNSFFQQPSPSQSFQVQNYQRPSPPPPPPRPTNSIYTQTRKPLFDPPAKQSYQKPVNTHFPPPRPSRPSPPITRFYFPPARQNVIFKTQNPQGPHIISRPTTFYGSSPSASSFRPNSISIESTNFGKSRFPSSRPDPNTFRAQFAPPPPSSNRYAYSTTSSSSSTSIQTSASELKPLNYGSRLNNNNSRDPQPHHHHHHHHHSANTNNRDQQHSGGSAHPSSAAITRDLFKPEFIESIQPSRMVAYRYLTSSENNGESEN